MPLGVMPRGVARTADAVKTALRRIPPPIALGAIVATVVLLIVAALPGGGSTSGGGLVGVVGGRLGTADAQRALKAKTVLLVYLDPQGSDDNDGSTLARAVRSLAAVQRVIAAARPSTDVEVRIKQGTYIAPPLEWTTYVPGRTILFLPLGYELGESAEGISSRPVFRSDGSNGFWFRAVPSTGAPGRLGFYFLKVERYSAGGIAFDGQNSTNTPGVNGNTVYGMTFRELGSRHARSGVGYGGIDLINSRNNVIQHNTFEQLENGPTKETLVHGVYLSHRSSNNLIKSNKFYRISGDPIRTRDGSNENKVFDNTFKRTGANAYFSDWFSADDGGDGGTECASHANAFYNNKLISGYRGPVDEWWTSPLQSDYATRGCTNDTRTRVHTWGNRRQPAR
jgi:hypothetical protein